MESLEKLCDKVLSLNPEAGEIGQGMLCQLVALANEAKKELHDIRQARREKAS